MFSPRWQAKAIYRTNGGPVDVVHDMDELGEVQDLIEAGPHWDTLLRIEITRLNNRDGVTLTVEQATHL